MDSKGMWIMTSVKIGQMIPKLKREKHSCMVITSGLFDFLQKESGLICCLKMLYLTILCFPKYTSYP